MRRILATILVFGVLACGGDSPAAPVTRLDGTWNGKTNGYSISLGLTQMDTVVTGSGVMAGNTGAAQLTVNGTFKAPDVDLTISSLGALDFTFIGQLSTRAAQMVGELNGSGFDHLAITLTKQ